MKTFIIIIFISSLVFAQQSIGELRTAVILTKFQDDPDNVAYLDGDIPLTPQLCRSIIFDSSYSVAGFIHENSYGKLNVLGDVFGPYVIPVNAPTDSTLKNCRSYEETIAVADPDIQFNSYDMIIFIYPRTRDKNGDFVNCCGFQGLQGNVAITTDEGEFPLGCMWINGFLDIHVVVHEMGHYFGLMHADRRHCFNCYDYDYWCTVHETGDPYDVMGYSTAEDYTAPGHFSAYNKYTVNWLDDNNVFQINRYGNYDVTLSALEEKLNDIKMVTITAENDHYYYIEFRQNKGYDSCLPPLNGLLIRRSSAIIKGSTELLESFCNSTDPILREGQDFYDKNLYIHVHAISQSNNTMKIRINYGAPDIRVESNMELWPDSLFVGDSLTFPFDIYNESSQPFLDSLYLYSEVETPVGIFHDTSLVAVGINIGEKISSTFSYKFQDGCGAYNFKLYVFSFGIFDDINPSNNYLTDQKNGANTVVSPFGPDLFINFKTPAIAFSPHEQIDISYDIKNVGQIKSDSFSIHFQSPHQEKTEIVSGLDAGQSISRSFQETYDCGIHAITVLVDPENAISENNEKNNSAKLHIWSDYLCDNQITKPIFVGPLFYDFFMNDNTLFLLTNNQLYSFSLIDFSTQFISSFENRTHASSYDVSNNFLVRVDSDSNPLLIYIHDLNKGTVEQPQLEYDFQNYATVNDEWAAWQERAWLDYKETVFAKNLKSGKKHIINTTTELLNYNLHVTDTNLLFWIRWDFEDIYTLMVFDLDNKAGPFELTIPGYRGISCYWKNTIITTERFESYSQITAFNFDKERQNFTSNTLFSDQYCDVIDYNGAYLLYDSDERRKNFSLYSIQFEEQRDITNIMGDFVPMYVRDDKIVGKFRHDKHYCIGSIKIEDIWNGPTGIVEFESLDSSPRYSAAPNPFNNITTIRYSVEKSSDVELLIFNTMGQLVRTFTANHSSPGDYMFNWDGTKNNKEFVSSGVYFCVLKINGSYVFDSKRLKLALLK